MVLLHVLQSIGFKIAIAHCNFKLRGTESDLDEKLVRTEAERLGVPFHVLDLSKQYRTMRKGQSLQMWAREARYEFFNELMDKHGYSLTAMAHHADDRLESLMINLLRGTGLKGMQGMPARSKRFIRPLLSVRKHEITSYAQENGITFRDDSSNFTPKYLRNKVRLQLLPMLRQLKPETDSVMLRFTDRVACAQPGIEAWSTKMKEQLSSRDDTCDVISREKLSGLEYPFTALHFILQPHGFSSAQTLQLITTELPNKGVLKSKSHAIYIEPKALRIVSLRSINTVDKLHFKTIERENLKTLDLGSETVVVDAQLLDMEQLDVRFWKSGDRFHPLGMSGSKKLSDFMIDEGFTQFQKDTLAILTNAGEIVWVIGYRMDDRFKVTESTRRVSLITRGRKESMFQ